MSDIILSNPSETSSQISTVNTEKSPEYLEKVTTLCQEIDIYDPTLSISYGVHTMNAISKFADSLMEQVQAKNAGEIGQQLTDLMTNVKSANPDIFTQQDGFLAQLPVIGGLFQKIERSIAEHQTLAQHVDSIAAALNQNLIHLLRDIETLDQLYGRNQSFYQEVAVYIEAGKEKLHQVKTHDLPTLQQQAAASNDMMAAQQVKDLVDNIQRFERRLHDLELSKTIAYQTAPQIRLIQSNNQTLAEKIQSSILSTIPIWKNQIVLAITLHTQRNALKLQKDISDTTNELLRKNAEMLSVNSIETAKETERSIVDIETLRAVQAKLVQTIEETVSIAQEARTRRLSVEQELQGMEEELRHQLRTASQI